MVSPPRTMDTPTAPRKFSFTLTNASTSSLKLLFGSLFPYKSGNNHSETSSVSADSLSLHHSSPPQYFNGADDDSTNPFLSDNSITDDPAPENPTSGLDELELWLIIYSCQWNEQWEAIKLKVDSEFDRLWGVETTQSPALLLGYEPSLGEVSASSSESLIRLWASASIKLPLKRTPLREKHGNIEYSPQVVHKGRRRWWKH